MGTFADLERKIEELPDADFRVFTSSLEPASEEELRELESRMGRPFPGELRKLYRTWGVLAVEAADTAWPRPKELDVLPSWRFQYGFHVLGAGNGIPRSMQLGDSLTEEAKKAGVVPFLRRIGTRFFCALTANGLGSFQPGEEGIEDIDGDPIDWILFEINELEIGIARIRASEGNADALMETGRKAKWMGPVGSDAVNALKGRPPSELALHLSELVDTLLPDGRLSMGCLDILATADLDAFRPVAERVYAHTGDREWVIELLAKLGDTAPGAIACYQSALESDDDDVYDKALDAVLAIAKAPAVKTLIPTMKQRLDDLEGDNKMRTIAVLGQLGEPFIPAVLEVLPDIESDDLNELLRGLKGLPLAGSEVEPLLRARLGTLDAKARPTLAIVEALLALGIEDRNAMEPIAKGFHARGGNWATRAQAVLDRFQ